MSAARALIGATVLTVLPACLQAPATEAKLPEYAPQGQATAAAAASPTRPLIVEWPAADRAALEAQRSAGVVVVRYGSGEMTVLSGCRAEGRYRYVSLTPKEEGFTLHDVAELNAAVPIHAASLEGHLAQNQELSVQLTIVGTYQAPSRAWASSDLRGSCAGATHVLQALTVGAFEIAASARSGASAEARLGSAGVDGRRESRREVLHRDGKKEACAKSGARDGEPPFECGAMLRVEVSPVQFAATSVAGGGVAVCGPGLVRKGDACESVASDRPPLLEVLQAPAH
jgi:hypothetical protein